MPRGRTARTPSPGTTSPRTARGRRRPRAAARRSSRRPPRSRRCSSTQSATVSWKWRTRSSWSHSGNSRRTPESSACWVPSSVPASCRANSLNTTAATSCSTRSRTVVAGWKYSDPLEPVRVVRCRPVPVRQVPPAVDQDLEVREDLEVVDAPRVDPAGVHARRRRRCRAPSHGPSRPLRSATSIGYMRSRRQRPPPGTAAARDAVRAVELEVRALERRVRVAHGRAAPAAGAARARGSTPGTRRGRSSSWR